MRIPSNFSTAVRLCLCAKWLVFVLLSFSSCVGHKDEKGEASKPWKKSRKFLHSDSVEDGDKCVPWSDWFKHKVPKLAKRSDFALSHSVLCGGP